MPHTPLQLCDEVTSKGNGRGRQERAIRTKGVSLYECTNALCSPSQSPQQGLTTHEWMWSRAVTSGHGCRAPWGAEVWVLGPSLAKSFHVSVCFLTCKMRTSMTSKTLKSPCCTIICSDLYVPFTVPSWSSFWQNPNSGSCWYDVWAHSHIYIDTRLRTGAWTVAKVRALMEQMFQMVHRNMSSPSEE